MKTAKQDRRSQRTRQLLGSALVELMLEQRFDTITVQDILERANVGRSTFYEHYTDKEDLLMSEIFRVLHALQAHSTTPEAEAEGLIPSLEFFRHIREQQRLLHTFLIGRGAEYLTHEMEAQLSKLAEHNLLALAGGQANAQMPIPLTARFVARTFLMLAQWWSEQDMRQTPEEMNALFLRLVMPGVRAALASDLNP
ncbi:MAG: TetR/AcrR family transcriptional regulator C-terminal domain-containing protein [Anaerolineae bacterium]|nr:TetR/AcrR family transcriptional regulator C-terminal domain-containing protein [Anaerolineae bacterium]